MRLNQELFIATVATALAIGGSALAQSSAPPSDTATPEVPPPVTAPAPATEPAQMEEPAPMNEPAPMTPPPPMASPMGVPAYPDRGTDILLPQPTERWRPMSGIGLALSVGGGVTDFTGGTTRSETSTGGAWTARLAVATRSIVGFDASYVGGANRLSGLGFGNTTLVRNGLEGALRINAPLYAHDTLFEPYAIGGVGWNAYRLANVNSTTASVSGTTDNTLTIPLGVGFAMGYRGFIADVRYTIRPTYDQQIFVNQSNTALTNWDLGGMLGYEF